MAPLKRLRYVFSACGQLDNLMQHVAPVVEHFGGARSAIGCLSTTNDACALYRMRHISEFSYSIGIHWSDGELRQLRWPCSGKAQAGCNHLFCT